MKYARRSVSDNDIRKYEMFSQTLQQSRLRTELPVPDEPGRCLAAGGRRRWRPGLGQRQLPGRRRRRFRYRLNAGADAAPSPLPPHTGRQPGYGTGRTAV